MRQLTFDGRDVEHPPRVRALTQRQREILGYVRAVGEVRPLDIGRMMRLGRETPERRGHERHVSSDGVDALQRLERRGLVYRAARGRWSPVVEREDGWS